MVSTRSTSDATLSAGGDAPAAQAQPSHWSPPSPSSLPSSSDPKASSVSSADAEGSAARRRSSENTARSTNADLVRNLEKKTCTVLYVILIQYSIFNIVYIVL